MKKTTIAFVLLLALLLAIPWLAHAGRGHHGGTRVFIGGSFWFGPPVAWGPPAWGPAPFWAGPVFYSAPPVVVQPRLWCPPAPVFVERGRSEADYWYYCDNPQGFYPYVRSCPGGWMKVVPETVPPNR